MWDEWCGDDPFAMSAGDDAGGCGNPHALLTTAPPSPGSDDGVGDDVWGLVAAAITGIAAYEGVRRLIARGRRNQASNGVRSPVATVAAEHSPDDARPSAAASTSTDPPEPVPQTPTTASRAAEPPDHGPDLVGDLIALHDLEPSDALRRRIIRSLAKAGVRADDDRGIAFDPERHDVVGTVRAEPGAAPGTVVDVMRSGFARADGTVIRAAEVVVATDADGSW